MFGKLVLLLAAVTNARENRYLRGSPGLVQTNVTKQANYTTGLVPYMSINYGKRMKYPMCTKSVALYSNKTVNTELYIA